MNSQLDKLLKSNKLYFTAYKMGRTNALQDFSEMIFKVEGKRITDNNDYISIPIKDWEELKSQLSHKKFKQAIGDKK